MKVEIKSGTISEVVQLSKAIPEFANPHGQNEYLRRFDKAKHCILIAFLAEDMVGFKVGYDRLADGITFYSWMGGVLPKFRNQGVAQFLQLSMESWCLKHGFMKLHCKTRNSHVPMIHFLLKNEFYLIGLATYDDPMENRLLFEKKLKG